MKFHLSLHVYCNFADCFEVDRGVDFGLSIALLRAQAVRHFESLRNQPEPGTGYITKRLADKKRAELTVFIDL